MASSLDTGKGRRGGMISGINVTPLVDVVLVLLIIFMVTSLQIVSQALKVELPHAKSSDGSSDGPATLTLAANGEVRWNDTVIPEDSVANMIKEAVAAAPGLELVISADKAVQHGRVVHFIDVAKLSGITKFAINVERGE